MYIIHDKDYYHLPIDGWSTRLQTCLESNIFPKKKWKILKQLPTFSLASLKKILNFFLVMLLKF